MRDRHNSALISIDFGSAFTKVGFRKKSTKFPIERDSGSANAKAGVRLQELGESVNLIDLLNLRYDPDSLCIPTLVARAETPTGVVWYAGSDAGELRENEKIKIYTNWKQDIFNLNSTAKEQNECVSSADSVVNFLKDLMGVAETSHLIDTIAAAFQLERGPVSDLAAKHSLSTSQLHEAALRLGLVGINPTLRPLEYGQGSTIGSPNPSIAEFEHAVQYFKWLLEYVNTHSMEKGLPSPLDTYSCICIPSFKSSGQGSALSGSILIQKILEKAGWNLDPDNPVLEEPMTNAIGLMTEGKNWVGGPMYRDETISLRWDRMFQNSSIKSFFKHDSKKHVILVVDVGAFTSDFAVLSFDADDCDRCPECRTHSIRLGVSQLDDEILASLPLDKQSAVRSLNLDGRESFRKEVYSNGKSFELYSKGVQLIVGGESEGHMIIDQIESFADRVGLEIVEFLQHEEFKHLDQIMFTGGGSQIERIVKIIRKKLANSHPRAGIRHHVCHSPSPRAVHDRNAYARLAIIARRSLLSIASPLAKGGLRGVSWRAARNPLQLPLGKGESRMQSECKPL